MLKIISHMQLVDSMRLAKETGTEDQLIHWLLWLDEFMGRENTIVELLADMPFSPGSIYWVAWPKDRYGEEDARAHMNGGLIYHQAAKEWSVHS